MNSKYIYGIIDSSDDEALGIAGLGGMVHTVAYEGVGCVLSDYPEPAFHCASKEQIVQCLLKHQEVVEHVMKRHTVLPVKFGTTLAASSEVYELLFQGHHQLTSALAKMADKVEIEVAATWDIQRVLQEVSNEEEVVRGREAISRGQATTEQRINLGKLVKASLDRRRESYRDRMLSFLQPMANDVQLNALVSDQMVLNVAFLLDGTEHEKLLSRISQLNDLFHNQIDFRVIGPLPPYSFATVEVTRPNRQQIEEARQLLHLGESITEAEVRKAYRRLAAEAHPDSRPGDQTAKSQFAKLRQASELLIAYCRGQAGSKGDLLISIKRQRPEEVQTPGFSEAMAIAGATHG